MRARLLERDAELGRLRDALGRAGRGRGSVVLVSGEAGIGKTALVRAFADAARAQARVLTGVCDDLGTPRTLGPFRDMARAGGGPLVAAADAGAERDAVFDAVHRELAARPTVLLVEDLHWADDATLDVVRWLAWRIAELPSLLVVTYRDDLAADAPMWRVLGALARQDALRLELRPLSAAAVRELAGAAGADPGAVLGATGGNPFFVTEVLANPDVAVPATVRDAVLARLDGLGEATRRCLELLSVVPGRAERWLAERLLGDATAALDEAERRGVLEADPAAVWFRHELARRAIEQELSASARVACHRRVLAALAERSGVELSRLAHHAAQAGEPEQVARHGLAAAREAAAAGAFSEALALGEATGQPDVVAHSLNYLGYAMLDLGEAAGAGHCGGRWRWPGPPATTSTASGATPTWSRGCTGWAGSASWTSRSPRAWPTPAATGSPPTSTTWRPTAACCSPCGAASPRPRPGCGGCWPARTRGCWPASGCRPWGGCWPAGATPGRPPCWTGPGRRPPAPARSRRSPWPARPGSRRPGWPATPRVRPPWPGCPWSGPRPGAPSATGASC